MFRVRSTQETFERIENLLGKRMAYVRFGDGEMLLMSGWRGREEQHWNSKRLQVELCQSFLIKDDVYLISLPPFQKEEGMKEGLFIGYGEGTLERIEQTARMLVPERETYDNAVALHYTALFHPDKVISFFDKARDLGLGVIAPFSILKTFPFSMKRSVETPSRQAYYKIDDFYPKIVSVAEHCKVLFLALGVSANVVAKRLWKEGYEGSIIDGGSFLDITSGVFSPRTWIYVARDEVKNYRQRIISRFSKL